MHKKQSILNVQRSTICNFMSLFTMVSAETKESKVLKKNTLKNENKNKSKVSNTIAKKSLTCFFF